MQGLVNHYLDGSAVGADGQFERQVAVGLPLEKLLENVEDLVVVVQLDVLVVFINNLDLILPVMGAAIQREDLQDVLL